MFDEQKKAEFQNTINFSWVVSVAGEIFESIRDIIPNIARLLAQLYTETDSVNFSDEWVALLNQSFYKWCEKFINKGTELQREYLTLQEKDFIKQMFMTKFCQIFGREKLSAVTCYLLWCLLMFTEMKIFTIIIFILS